MLVWRRKMATVKPLWHNGFGTLLPQNGCCRAFPYSILAEKNKSRFYFYFHSRPDLFHKKLGNIGNIYKKVRFYKGFSVAQPVAILKKLGNIDNASLPQGASALAPRGAIGTN